MTRCRGKASYATEDIAEASLRSVRKSKYKREVTPIRVYRCEFCGQYHMTSKPVLATETRLIHYKEFEKYLNDRNDRA